MWNGVNPTWDSRHAVRYSTGSSLSAELCLEGARFKSRWMNATFVTT
jgi:hypothetical protein